MSDSVNTVLLDAAGTIFDYPHRFEELWVGVLASRSHVVDERTLMAAWAAQVASESRWDDLARRPTLDAYQLRWHEACCSALRAIGYAGNLDEAADAMWLALIVGKVQPFDDVAPTLRKLSAMGVTLGVVANYSCTLEIALEGHDLARYFAGVVSSGRTGLAKPNPGMFSVALRSLGVEAHQAVHVGDSYESDVVGARHAGVTPILLVRDRHRPVREDVCTIRSLSELPELISAGRT